MRPIARVVVILLVWALVLGGIIFAVAVDRSDIGSSEASGLPKHRVFQLD